MEEGVPFEVGGAWVTSVGHFAQVVRPRVSRRRRRRLLIRRRRTRGFLKPERPSPLGGGVGGAGFQPFFPASISQPLNPASPRAADTPPGGPLKHSWGEAGPG